MGISRGSWHKRLKTGGRQPKPHVKRKFELGRPAANTRIGVPSVFVQQDLDNGSLVRVLADFAPPPVEIHALYPSSRFLASKVRLFLDFVRDDFLDIPALQVPVDKPKRVPRIRAKVAG